MARSSRWVSRASGLLLVLFPVLLLVLLITALTVVVVKNARSSGS